MAPALAFRFLTLVLFFFANGRDISARELKVELGDQKEVDSKDEPEPYLTQYGGNKLNYAASYTTTKHSNHLSRPEKPNQPYSSGYNGYKTSPTGHKARQPNYIAGYRTHTQDSSEPYIAAYGKHEVKQTNYNSGYRTPIDDSNEPYITSYGNHEAKQSNYIAGYRTHSHGSNSPYNSAYLGYTIHDKTHTHDSSGPYNSAYLGYPYTSHTHGKTYIQEPNEPSITNGDANEANQPYIAGYRSASRDSNEAPSAKENLGVVQRREAFKVGFFTLEDIYVGNVMTLQFPVQEVSPFLSRKEADSMPPLSMSQFSSVLQLFSIPEDSPQAKSMRRTLEQCEDEPITGETKICANSLESMLEFIGKVIGTDAKHDILSTSYPSPSAIPLQNYTILKVSRDIDAPKWVACHPLPYPYAIHYCHFIATGTKVFKVSLVGESNGDKIEALGLCHLDTSDWSPDHIIFKQLGIKAGKEAPVCHFFPVKHLLWIPQPSKATV